jgi:BirA family biotin operon repressor/biotin-[acetyl-CoA-carboxylase] ligase
MFEHSPVHRLESTTSTMDEARTLAQKGAPSGTLVVALHQTAGRGRRGRQWMSDTHEGLWCTFILKPEHTTAPLHTYSLVAALSVCQTFHSLGITQARVKWPNDIWIQHKKAAGLLLEAESNTLLLGIGINLSAAHTLSLPKDIENTYTGLLEHITPTPTANALRETLLEKLLAQLKHDYLQWAQEGLSPYLQAWESMDALHQSYVSAEIGAETVQGYAQGIEPDGRIRIATSDGMRYVGSGEVIRLRHA